jgi:predicted ATP-grasp superfamily ATP-dependent carboligase
MRSAAQAPAAFVLGLNENGYGVVRSLGRAGIRVLAFHSEADEYGRLSRLCEAHRLPPRADDAALVRALVARRAHFAAAPVLFPTSDRAALLLARQAIELAPHFRFHWVGAQALEAIVDKAAMSVACARAGVPAPRTRVTRAHDDPLALAHELDFPCLIKPRRFNAPFPPRLKNFLARTRADLTAFLRAHPQTLGATVCQEVIEGGDDHVFQCTALIGAGGAPRATFCARKLHQYRPGFGVMCFGRSEYNEAVVAQALQLLHFLGYRGLASLEFKYRARDGRYYFIEMNPRLPWYSALFAAAGMNLPQLAWLDLTGGIGTPPARQRDGVHWLSAKLDVGWFVATRGARREGLLGWLRSIARARACAWFDARDPLPWMRATLALPALVVRRACATARARAQRASGGNSRRRQGSDTQQRPV